MVFGLEQITIAMGAWPLLQQPWPTAPHVPS
jgi:hypothetical protein